MVSIAISRTYIEIQDKLDSFSLYTQYRTEA